MVCTIFFALLYLCCWIVGCRVQLPTNEQRRGEKRSRGRRSRKSHLMKCKLCFTRHDKNLLLQIWFSFSLSFSFIHLLLLLCFFYILFEALHYIAILWNFNWWCHFNSCSFSFLFCIICTHETWSWVEDHQKIENCWFFYILSFAFTSPPFFFHFSHGCWTREMKQFARSQCFLSGSGDDACVSFRRRHYFSHSHLMNNEILKKH